MYVECPDGSLRFRWLKVPTSAELARLTQALVLSIGRHLERQGLLERDAENTYLAGDDLEASPMEQLVGSSITYRIAVGPQQGRKVFTLQTLPACDEPFDDGVGKVAGFSLHAGASGSTPEARAAVSLHQPAGHLGKAPVGDAERQRSVSAEDTVSRRASTARE